MEWLILSVIIKNNYLLKFSIVCNLIKIKKMRQSNKQHELPKFQRKVFPRQILLENRFLQTRVMMEYYLNTTFEKNGPQISLIFLALFC